MRERGLKSIINGVPYYENSRSREGAWIEMRWRRATHG